MRSVLVELPIAIVAGVIAQAVAGVIAALRSGQVPPWVGRLARILRVVIPLATVLGSTAYGLWVGVWKSQATGHAADRDLASVQMSLSKPPSVVSVPRCK